MTPVPPLTNAYSRLLEELADKKKYAVRTVYEHYVVKKGLPDPNRITVVLRIDVDSCFHLAFPLAEWIHYYGLTATHYFLTHPGRYYSLWDSNIPKKIYELGQEVGLHTDHYYEQLVFNKNGLAELKADIIKLGQLVGEPIKGMVYHGHPDIDSLGVTNWDLTAGLASSDLGLEYHDGLKSVYIAPGATSWRPKCDHRISDFMGFPYSWGWNYLPFYPGFMLKLYGRKGKTFHIAFHTKNAFEYWKYWTSKYHEQPIARESLEVFWKKRVLIFYRYFIAPIWQKPVVGVVRFLGIEGKVRRWLKR